MYCKAVQAEAAERRECNDPDPDPEKGNVQRWGVAPSSTVPDASSSPSSCEELYFMSAFPLIESLKCISLDIIWLYWFHACRFHWFVRNTVQFDKVY